MMRNLLMIGLFIFSTIGGSCDAGEKISETEFTSYRLAFVRSLSDSFEESLKLAPPPLPIDINLAKLQHDNYIELLKGLLEEVVILDSDSKHPDCNFIEDTALIVGEDAVISNMGAFERRGEEHPVAHAIANLGTKRITHIYAPGTMDGGDILYTGSHLFVGLSRRTNTHALVQLKEIFRDKVEVIGIPVTEGLHLKSIISVFDQDILVVADTETGHEVQNLISKATNVAYTFISVPDVVASNVLRIGSTLIMQEGFPKSEAILREHCMTKQLNLVTINMSELIKADGALTCGSLLLN
jgi:dimethylargininase